MKLEELIPEEKDLLELTAEKLADQILICLLKNGNSIPVRRKGLAARMVMGYPREFDKESLFAIEEAVMYLEHEMFIGIDPEEREFVFITRAGKRQAEKAEGKLLTPAV
jgi:hypothetical protein